MIIINFTEDVRFFFFYRFDELQSDLLQATYCLCPTNAVSSIFKKTNSFDLFLQIFTKIIVFDQKIIRQKWHKLSDFQQENYMDIHKITVSDFWLFINNFLDEETEQYVFAELSSICLVASAISHSNVTTERRFSDIKNAKTDKRNALSTETLNGIIRARDVIAANQTNGFFEPPEALVDFYFDKKINR